ncbi:MAG: 16S rRNA (adenine(1518)-N(6)/adenine(1519)-N(6))-dimethyltransferase RsmA [Candidatus Micrarchaeota archaeon]|nr:16S rRNA (adenine(1518)-N(6)/adenine(1519)-N(6))-dimethyltransferase RsmA [Candidatus Micrarchaeota archaeon]
MQLKKFLGQNFLQDHNILRKEAELAEVEGKTVLEIGPGDGRLTEKLLFHKPKKLTVVEKDTRFAELLKDKFGDTIEILNADFLDTTLDNFEVIIGNIPYNITSPIIFKIATMQFERALLMVQKEFAEKMIATANKSNYGRLSVTAQLAFEITLIQIVPAHLFVPKPKVDSAIIILEKNMQITEKDEEVIRYLFQHRNQNAKNALKHSKKFSEEKLSLLGDYAARRVRTLTKEECLEISKRLAQHGII